MADRAGLSVRQVARSTLRNLWEDRVYWLFFAPVAIALWVHR